MAEDTLHELYTWAKDRLDSTIMHRYILYKVNGQTPGRVSMLLRDVTSRRANAEIEVEYNDNFNQPYQVVFSLLPFNIRYPYPAQLRPTFNTEQEVIYWIKTGQK